MESKSPETQTVLSRSLEKQWCCKNSLLPPRGSKNWELWCCQKHWRKMWCFMRRRGSIQQLVFVNRWVLIIWKSTTFHVPDVWVSVRHTVKQWLFALGISLTVLSWFTLQYHGYHNNKRNNFLFIGRRKIECRAQQWLWIIFEDDSSIVAFNYMVKHQLLVGSIAPLTTVNWHFQIKNSVTRKCFARMNDYFESKELNAVRWIPESANSADALTKERFSFEGTEWYVSL